MRCLHLLLASSLIVVSRLDGAVPPPGAVWVSRVPQNGGIQPAGAARLADGTLLLMTTRSATHLGADGSSLGTADLRADVVVPPLVDAFGAVVTAGTKYDGLTGHRLWPSRPRSLLPARLDRRGDLVGVVGDGTTTALGKVDGVTGETVWLDTSWVPAGIELDREGDVLSFGDSENARFFMKHDGRTGRRLWGPLPFPVRRTLYDPFLTAVEPETGDVIVAVWAADPPACCQLLIVKIAGATGALVWGPSPDALLWEAPVAMALDGGGGLILTSATTTNKLDARTGARVWGPRRMETPEGVRLTHVAVLANGDAVVIGSSRSVANPRPRWSATCYEGPSGRRLWGPVDLGPGTQTGPKTVLSDGDGLLLFGTSDPERGDPTAIRLDASSGTVSWSRVVARSAPRLHGAWLRVDPFGAPFLLGELAEKLDPETGRALWRAGAWGTEYDGLTALGPDGDVFQVSTLDGSFGEVSLVTSRYRGTDGSLEWGPVVLPLEKWGGVHAIVVDAGGDLLVSATEHSDSRTSHLTYKLSGTDGHVLWGPVPQPGETWYDGSLFLAVGDGDGDALLLDVATRDGRLGLTAQRLRGADGALRPGPGYLPPARRETGSAGRRRRGRDVQRADREPLLRSEPGGSAAEAERRRRRALGSPVDRERDLAFQRRDGRPGRRLPRDADDRGRKERRPQARRAHGGRHLGPRPAAGRAEPGTSRDRRLRRRAGPHRERRVPALVGNRRDRLGPAGHPVEASRPAPSGHRPPRRHLRRPGRLPRRHRDGGPLQRGPAYRSEPRHHARRPMRRAVRGHDPRPRRNAPALLHHRLGGPALGPLSRSLHGKDLGHFAYLRRLSRPGARQRRRRRPRRTRRAAGRSGPASLRPDPRLPDAHPARRGRRPVRRAQVLLVSVAPRRRNDAGHPRLTAGDDHLRRDRLRGRRLREARQLAGRGAASRASRDGARPLHPRPVPAHRHAHRGPRPPCGRGTHRSHRGPLRDPRGRPFRRGQRDGREPADVRDDRDRRVGNGAGAGTRTAVVLRGPDASDLQHPRSGRRRGDLGRGRPARRRRRPDRGRRRLLPVALRFSSRARPDRRGSRNERPLTRRGAPGPPWRSPRRPDASGAARRRVEPLGHALERAIFAVTSDPFIVYTSNIFAILGLRSLYFLLAGVLEKLRYLKVALASLVVPSRRTVARARARRLTPPSPLPEWRHDGWPGS